MEHLLLKASTSVATDEGTFEAVISAATVDRERDIVDPDGMVAALRKWTTTGKKIPLAWQHSTAAEDQIGYIDPATAKNVNGEVVVSGWVDQSTPVGQGAWRLVKAGTLGFSFGYLTLNGAPRKGGGTHIKELDVFEVTATPTPMNNDTRVLGWKAAMPMSDPTETGDQPPTATQMRILNSMVGQAQEYIASNPDAEDAAEMADVIETLEELRGEPDTEDEGPDAQSPEKAVDATGKSLRKRADAVALEHASGGRSLRKSRGRTKQFTDTTRELLSGAGTERFGGANTCVYVDDFDPTAGTVVYCISSDTQESRYVRVTYSTAADNTVTLGGEETEVVRMTSYQPKSAGPAKSYTDLESELQEVKASLESLTKKAEVTGKESSRTRSADPLRARADAMALEHASGGESLKKPPQPAQKAPVDLLPLRELKRRMREEMLTALSGKES